MSPEPTTAGTGGERSGPTAGLGTLPSGGNDDMGTDPTADAGAGGGASSGVGRTSGAGKSATPPRRRWIVEWAIVIVVALLVAFVVRTFVAQTFYVPSTSMYPTLKAGDRIVVDKLAYHFHGIHVGDIVVFRRPPAEHCGGPPVPDLVKRVIGLPGQTLSAKGGQVYVTGKILQEPWLPHVASTYTSNFGPERVPAGEYFMMGDNRVASCDSRMWGPVKRSYIVGKVDFIIWPLSQLRFF